MGGQGLDSSLAGGWIEVASIVHPAGEVVVSMRPVCVFANVPSREIEQVRGALRGRWRQAARAVMVLLSLHGLSAAQIAELLECHPATVRRWIGRFSTEGLAGLADRPRSGRPPLGGKRLTRRIAALLDRPGPWTLPRIWRYLGYPQVSLRTLYRRVRRVAVWRRPKLIARGDPDHDHVVAGIVARLIELPRRAVVLAEDETHLNLLPHVRASWTRRGARPQILTPGTNRQVTVYGALEMTTGRWVYRLGGRRAAEFIAFLRMLAASFPAAPLIVVICDNDSIHHARAVTRYLGKAKMTVSCACNSGTICGEREVEGPTVLRRIWRRSVKALFVFVGPWLIMGSNQTNPNCAWIRRWTARARARSRPRPCSFGATPERKSGRHNLPLFAFH